ncbi:MAG: hypothetical protein GQ547_03275 [Methylophaga sp.]|nr:hypothetical protein [Methylophaga sp.]
MTASNIKKVAEGIYYLVVKDAHSCSMCGAALSEYMKKISLSDNSKLILDADSSCSTPCNKLFLEQLSKFKFIAYIMKNAQSGHSWEHAGLVQDQNTELDYFIDYEDAYEWCTER